MLVAVNKIDKEGAQPDRVRTEMTNLGLQPEEWGGETMFVDVSAKTKQNLDDLHGVDPARRRGRGAQGQPGRQRLRPGHRVQARPGPRRRRDRARPARHAEDRRRRRRRRPLGPRARHARLPRHPRQGGRPVEPVEVLGFDSVPEAGEFVRVVENDRTARSLAGERANRLKLEQQARRSGKKMSLETIFDQAARRASSPSSTWCSRRTSPARWRPSRTRSPSSRRARSRCRSCAPASAASRSPTSTWPSASDAVVLGFNVRPVGEAAQLADREGVEIRSYSVIYRAIDELRDAMQGMLAPEEVEETVGTAEVRAIFRASRVGTIAGSMVTDGRITRGAKIRLVRDGTVVHTGEIGSLRRVNDDVREVARRLRVRHRARELRGRQGRRHHRGIRDAPGRAQALLVGCPASPRSWCSCASTCTSPRPAR